MRLHSPRLEASAVKTILTDDKLASYILPRITPEHFANEPTLEAFRRIQAVTRKRGVIPEWSDVIEDPVLSEETREYLRAEDVKVVPTRRHAARLVERLTEYRRIRILFDLSLTISKTVKEDKVDIELLTERVSEMLTKSRTSSSFADQMVNIGSSKNYDKLVKQILLGKKLDLLPTGFRSFDDVNGGIARGAVHLLAGTSGGGKSIMALQIAMHQALLGLRVCIVSLEMEREELLLRLLAHQSKVHMGHLIRAQNMSDSMRKQVRDAWAIFETRVRKNGGLLTIVSPEEDATLEDLLLMVKPFGYDNIVVDYLGLCKGMDGEDQWRKLGGGARFAKRFAAANKCVCTLLAQLSEDGIVRYSRALQEHASNMWSWTYVGEARESRLITVKQPKARNQRQFDFTLREEFEVMKLHDMEAVATTSQPEQTKENGRNRYKGRKGKPTPETTDDSEGVVYQM